MPILQDDMSQVPLNSENVPEGAYTFRCASVKIAEGEGTAGANRISFNCNVTTEGDSFGRNVSFNCDMGDSRGRSNLKTLYEVVGYKPGPEGHDPECVVDSEFRATVKHNTSKKDGVTYANIVPWSIKPLY